MMKTAAADAHPLRWDYRRLAAHYELRAPYDPRLWPMIGAALDLAAGARVADIGAGTGRIAAGLAALGARVDAVEPCREMREIGERQCAALDVHWHDSVGERTPLPSGCFDAVAFGSSLNVVEPVAGLAETRRLLAPGGVVVVVYNHRELDDPRQQAIEACIREQVPRFDAGSRREDPTALLQGAGLRVHARIELAFEHRVDAASFARGFRAHGTLARQAGDHVESVLESIARQVAAFSDADGIVSVPFVTRAWLARSAG